MKALQISSDKNEIFKKLKSLQTSKGIKEHDSFILSGEKLVLETLIEIKNNQHALNDRFEIDCLVNSEEFKLSSELEKLCNNLSVRAVVLSHELFQQVDALGTHSSLLCLKFKKNPFEVAALTPKTIDIVAPLTDPKNLGALARTAWAFDFKNIILTNDSAHPFLPTSLKSSSGAVLKMNWSKITEKLDSIENWTSANSYDWALDMDGNSVQKIKWSKPIRLWIGTEGQGIPKKNSFFKSMQKVTIPMSQGESLNATVASSIILWEIHNKLSSK